MGQLTPAPPQKKEMFKQMESNYFITPLDKYHAGYNPDYVHQLIAAHNGHDLFTRFVANIKLCRFFTFIGIGRLRVKEKDAYLSIARYLEEPIKEDYKSLFENESFKDFRFYHLTSMQGGSPGRMSPIKFEEEEHQKLFGSQSYNRRWHEAFKEFMRIEKEGLPTEQFEPNLVKQVESDLTAFEIEQQDKRNGIRGHDVSDTLPAPDVITWKYEIQYLGYLIADAVSGRNVNEVKLSELCAKYFTRENRSPIKSKTIRLYMQKRKNAGNTLKPHQQTKLNEISAKYSGEIEKICNYYFQTR